MTTLYFCSQESVDHLRYGIQLARERSKLQGKEEMFNKLAPIIENTKNHIREHNREEAESLCAIHEQYMQASLKRECEAREFCVDKSIKELREYLADRPVAYNEWKDANLEHLIKLVFEVYEAKEL